MTETPITDLHEYGLTHHQTGPLRRAGITTVEHLARLVDSHRPNPNGSVLSSIPGMGARRVDAACAAIDTWRRARHDREGDHQ